MTPDQAKAAVVKKDEPKQQRAGKGKLKYDRYLVNQTWKTKNNIMIKLNFIIIIN